MRVLSQALKVRANKLALNLVKKLLTVLKYVLKHPFKTIYNIIKIYVMLMLFLFFIAVSSSAFADENIPAKVITSSNLTVATPVQIAGAVFSSAHTAYAAYLNSNSGLRDAVCVSNSISTQPDKHNFTCNYVRVSDSANLSATLTATANSSSTIIYSCPPDGYPTYTEKSGSGSNTVCNEPYVAPPIEEVSCIAYAGVAANYGSFKTSSQQTPEQLAEAKCVSDLGDGYGDYANKCHVIGFGGWLESEVLDADTLEPTGEYRYSPINGTFSGYECDDSDTPTDPDESCTAFDNGRIKSVTCPDGTSMSVPWGDFLDAQDSLIAQQTATTASIDSVTGRVTTLEGSQVTANDIVVALSSDQAFKDSIKGDAGEGCDVARLSQGVFIDCGGTTTNIWDGTNGAKGEKGDAGADGGECQAIAGSSGVTIVCPTSSALLAKGTDGASGIAGVDGVDGVNGVDGDDCTTSQDGQDVIINCGGTTSLLEGVDEEGIIGAINGQTDAIEDIFDTSTATNMVFQTSEALQAELAPNDYEQRNYGTVMAAAVDQMKEAPMFTAVESFFQVSFGGSCPTYSANIDIINTSIVFDQWCQPIMSDVWPIISTIVLIVFSFLGFRVAVL